MPSRLAAGAILTHLGVLEIQWDPFRKKLVRHLLEEQDKVLRSYFAQKGGARSQGGEVVESEAFILFLLRKHFITEFFFKKNSAM
jgi:hypothetical protein